MRTCSTPAQGLRHGMDRPRGALCSSAAHRSPQAFLASRKRTQHVCLDGGMKRGDLYVRCGSGCRLRRGRVGCSDEVMDVVLPPLSCLASVSHRHNTHTQLRTSISNIVSPLSLRSVSPSPPSSLSRLVSRLSSHRRHFAAPLSSIHRISYPAPSDTNLHPNPSIPPTSLIK